MRVGMMVIMTLAVLILFGTSASALPGSVSASGFGSRSVDFSGYRWQVKESQVPVGPMANLFGGSAKSVSVDRSGSLIMRIIKNKDSWYASEVGLDRSLGWGTYTLHLRGFINRLDPNVILGIFTWDDDPEEAHRELDIEFSEWGGDTTPDNTQFVVQPWDGELNLHRFRFDQASADFSCSIEWTPGMAHFALWNGHGPQPLSGDASLYREWTRTGSLIPSPGGERFRINFYLNEGSGPKDGKAAEMMMTAFTFEPHY